MRGPLHKLSGIYDRRTWQRPKARVTRKRATCLGRPDKGLNQEQPVHDWLDQVWQPGWLEESGGSLGDSGSERSGEGYRNQLWKDPCIQGRWALEPSYFWETGRNLHCIDLLKLGGRVIPIDSWTTFSLLGFSAEWFRWKKTSTLVSKYLYLYLLYETIPARSNTESQQYDSVIFSKAFVRIQKIWWPK